MGYHPCPQIDIIANGSTLPEYDDPQPWIGPGPCRIIEAPAGDTFAVRFRIPAWMPWLGNPIEAHVVIIDELVATVEITEHGDHDITMDLKGKPLKFPSADQIKTMHVPPDVRWIMPSISDIYKHYPPGRMPSLPDRIIAQETLPTTVTTLKTGPGGPIRGPPGGPRIPPHEQKASNGYWCMFKCMDMKEMLSRGVVGKGKSKLGDTVSESPQKERAVKKESGDEDAKVVKLEKTAGAQELVKEEDTGKDLLEGSQAIKLEDTCMGEPREMAEGEAKIKADRVKIEKAGGRSLGGRGESIKRDAEEAKIKKEPT